MRTALQVAVLVEVFVVEWNELIEQCIVQDHFHGACIHSALVSDIALRRQVRLLADNRFAEELVEGLYIGTEADATVHIYRKVGPQVMDRLQVIMPDDLFEDDLYPGGHT